MIVFQGTFERVTHSTTWMGEGLDRHEYEKDELDKRIREFKLLYDGGGFACFLLCEPFFDGDTSRDLRATDLVKYFLLVDNLYRRNFATRVAHVTPVLSDFKRFLDRFGAASSWFETVGWKPRPIATVGRHLVGMVIGQRLFCVPSQLPEAKPGKIHEPDPNTKEFFELLVDGLVVVGRKLAVELPVWVDAYEFDREHDALGQKAVLLEEVSKLEAEIDAFKRFKWILIYDGDDLVDAVRYVLETGFGFAVEAAEEFQEDLKILGEDGKPLVFAEVKGTTRGVKREHVNQADSHRERAGLVPTFPSILIMNTSIKNARSLEEKDEPVAAEQIEHAKRHNVLILRTLDLLKLLALHKRGTVTRGEVQRLLSTGSGWLKVTDRGWELLAS